METRRGRERHWKLKWKYLAYPHAIVKNSGRNENAHSAERAQFIARPWNPGVSCVRRAGAAASGAK